MLTNFYNILHTVYLVNLQHNSYHLHTAATLPLETLLGLVQNV